MLSFDYPFIKLTCQDRWIGCKPALIFYALFILFSWAYRKRHFPGDGETAGKERFSPSRVCLYVLTLLLYFFSPLAGGAETLVTQMAETCLQYESLLSFSLLAALLLTLWRRPTRQHIRILHRAAVVLILGSVLFTLLARQVDSLWIANLAWFAGLGLACVQMSAWGKSEPARDAPASHANSFLPVKDYEPLFPRQKQLADRLADMIRTHDTREPLSICVAGEWGAGKTSVVNGAMDRLKRSCSYEYLYIQTMELDTLSSLFQYVFGRLRAILKKRGAYVGIGSAYRQFLTSALGKITDASLAAMVESRLFPSSEDYRVQIRELEACIASVLGDDKIVIIVDDVERCEPEKAQQFIFFIKEIAAMRSCVTVFIADYAYLNQRFLASLHENGHEPGEKTYLFYEKFFNYRIDVPPIAFEEAILHLERHMREDAEALRFRLPSALFHIFEEKLRQMGEAYEAEVEKRSSDQGKQKLLRQADALRRAGAAFRTSLSSPRALVKFCNTMGMRYAKLRERYQVHGAISEDTASFFSLIRFDELLFYWVYVEICAPYEALCVKTRGLSSLRCSSDQASDQERLLDAMGEDLLYSSDHIPLNEDRLYRYSEALRFTQAYIDGEPPAQVRGFSTRNLKWLHDIKVRNQAEIDAHWPDMVQMVLQNFGWKKPEEGEQYLDILFSEAQRWSSPEDIQRIFSIFEHSRHNEYSFSCHIAVMKHLAQKLGDRLMGCSPECVKLLEVFSSEYVYHRSAPIYRSALFMAPPDASRDEQLQKKIGHFYEAMLSSRNPEETLNTLLAKIRSEVPSIGLPPGASIFSRLRFLAMAEEKYLKEKGLLQYDDFRDHHHLLTTAIEDLEYFIDLLRRVRESSHPDGGLDTPPGPSDIDGSIRWFQAALERTRSRKDTNLQLRLQAFFTELRSMDALNDRQYDALQEIITESEPLYGNVPYYRKLLLDLKEHTAAAVPAPAPAPEADPTSETACGDLTPQDSYSQNT